MSARYIACRYVMFESLIGAAIKRRLPDAKWQQLSDRVRKIWRGFVCRLHHDGWLKCESRRNIQYMRNCPPVGLTTKVRSVPCGEALVCPYCFCRRYVLDLFMRFETGLYGSYTARRLKKPVWLVEFRSTNPAAHLRQATRRSGAKTRMASIDYALQQLAEAVSKGRDSIVKRLTSAGGFVLHRVFHHDKALP